MNFKPLQSPRTIPKVISYLAVLIFCFAFGSQGVSAATELVYTDDTAAGNNAFGWDSSNNQQRAASFVPAFDVELSELHVWLADTVGGGEPTDDARIRLCEFGSATNPCGSELESWDVNHASLTTTLTEITLNGTVSLDGGTEYAIIATRSGGMDVARYIFQRVGSCGTYENVIGSDRAFSRTAGVWSEGCGEGQMEFEVHGDYGPSVFLDGAVGVTVSNRQTVSAQGHTEGGSPSEMWISAVRIDPIGSHVLWQASPTNGTIDTLDYAVKELTNGTWRVRAHAVIAGTTYVSDYIDVVLTGLTWNVLTVDGLPINADAFATGTPVIYDENSDAPYTFSDEAAAAAAQGGLTIDAEGCAHVAGEDATSTLCTGTAAYNFLRDRFPLLTWPIGIFGAVKGAYDAVASATTSYTLAMPALGDGTWIGPVTVLDSASSGAGIGTYIPETAQAFFRSIMAFSIWVSFVLYMKRKADKLL